MDPAGAAVSSDGVALGLLIKDFSIDSQSLSAIIPDPVKKQNLINNVRSLKDKADDLFKSPGRTDTISGPPCSGGGILGFLDKVSCAIQSLTSIKTGLVAPAPPIATIEGELSGLRTVAKELQDPENEDNKQSTASKENTSKDTTSTASSNSQSTASSTSSSTLSSSSSSSSSSV
ncbi:hypothetical protein ABVK25_010745 [Lepraria finkii]|uniref:Uncharacterized protein n=1 Tax=Lepraria finkii TaxID=1340010 RepID=A0ABR4AV28_9LECA